MKSKEMKRAEAAERQAKYDALSKGDKFKLMKSRPGKSEREWMRVAYSA